jgi:hypothetical protein
VDSRSDHPYHGAAIVGMAKSILREAPEAALLWAAEVTDKDEHVDLVANTSRVIDQTTPSKAEAMLIEFRLDDSQKNGDSRKLVTPGCRAIIDLR